MDINVLLRRSGLKANLAEVEVLEKDLENILAMIEQLPEPDASEEKSINIHHHAHLSKDELFNEATIYDILKNAKSVNNDMFKIG